MGLQYREAGGQLRRDLRAQRRQEHAPRARARPERALDQGRVDVPLAVPLKQPYRSWAAAFHRDCCQSPRVRRRRPSSHRPNMSPKHDTSAGCGHGPRQVPKKYSFWLDPKSGPFSIRRLTLCLVGLLAWYLVSNTLTNLEKQSIATGFGFLQKEASFEIGESPDSVLRGRHLRPGLCGGRPEHPQGGGCRHRLTLFLGTLIGVARLSSNWLVSRMAAAYIEVMQNIPVLLQLFFWYAIFYEILPAPRQALNPMPASFCATAAWFLPCPRRIRLTAIADLRGRRLPASSRSAGAGPGNARRAPARASRVLLSLAAVHRPASAVWLVGGAALTMDVPSLPGSISKAA